MNIDNYLLQLGRRQRYLNIAIIILLLFVISLLINFMLVIKKCIISIEEIQQNRDFYKEHCSLFKDYYNRYKIYYDITNKWIKNKNLNKNIDIYFQENNIKSIAIYGIGEMAERLYEELKDKKIHIKYFIDRDQKTINNISSIPIIRTDDLTAINKVDAIIITPIYAYESIKVDIENNGTTVQIISLKDIIEYI